ncbi:MAG TPA: bifunctional 4-hydroxy-2-oxoglutarate aldolase/2-dehydro-3-deoxy-phosphogluconate aldolase, partial [Candidatus Dormibacteraeota bacterium]|nr:bifunctional 4-hydroxy-2-oxoglutarate aldolase/2-dehydro-3-deoxy-phosphogluconate aldolase [Candidatus Dormibacteraeota bacterium]
PLVGLLRRAERPSAVSAARAAARGGLRVIEVTMDADDPLAVLAAVAREVPEVTPGAGTVLSIEEARGALDAGARFIVSPHLDEDLVRFCAGADVPVIPGAATATEVVRAWQAGATMVKLFPAGPLGAPYVKALLEPLRRIDLMVTGGIGADNLASFFAAGARAAAIGGWLFASADPDVVEARARALVEAYRPR